MNHNQAARPLPFQQVVCETSAQQQAGAPRALTLSFYIYAVNAVIKIDTITIFNPSGAQNAPTLDKLSKMH